MPVLISGKREIKTFRSKEDVYDVVELLIKETKEYNEKGKSFDVASSVSKQLPFFACMNVFYSYDAQKDIEKYLYCKEFGVSPYEGEFNKQPKKWVEKSFLIKKAIVKKEEALIDKQKREMKNG